MTKLRKEIFLEAKVGDEIKVSNSIFRSDLSLYINYIDEYEQRSLIYYSTERNSPKSECETAFDEDCYLV